MSPRGGWKLLHLNEGEKDVGRGGVHRVWSTGYGVRHSPADAPAASVCPWAAANRCQLHLPDPWIPGSLRTLSSGSAPGRQRQEVGGAKKWGASSLHPPHLAAASPSTAAVRTPSTTQLPPGCSQPRGGVWAQRLPSDSWAPALPRGLPSPALPTLVFTGWSPALCP